MVQAACTSIRIAAVRRRNGGFGPSATLLARLRVDQTEADRWPKTWSFSDSPSSCLPRDAWAKRYGSPRELCLAWSDLPQAAPLDTGKVK